MRIDKNEIGDFNLSYVGSGILGANVKKGEFIGILVSEEAMQVNMSITKRPPMRYIGALSSDTDYLILHLPRSADVMCVFSKTSAFFIEDGKRIKTESEFFKIKKVFGEGDIMRVELEKELPNEHGVLCFFIGNHQFDLFQYEKSGVNTYNITSFTGEKEFGFMRDFDTVKVIKTVTVPSYVKKFKKMFEAKNKNYFLTGSNSSTYWVDVNGSFGELSSDFNGDVVATYHSRVIIGKVEADHLVLRCGEQDNVEGTSSKAIPLKLVQTYGSTFNWILGTNKGLLISTDKSIFVLSFDSYVDTKIREIVPYPGTFTNDTQAIIYRNFILFANKSGNDCFYAKYDIYTSEFTIGTLSSVTDIFVGEVIKKIDFIEMASVMYVLFLTESGRLIVGSTLQPNPNTISLAFSKWLIDYNIEEFIVYRGKNIPSFIVLMIRKLGYTVVVSIESVDHPRFQKKELLLPRLDFFKEQSTNDMIPKKPDLIIKKDTLADGVVFKEGGMLTFDLSSVFKFKNFMVGMDIVSKSDELPRFTITSLNSTNYIAEVFCKNDYNRTIILHSDDYDFACVTLYAEHIHGLFLRSSDSGMFQCAESSGVISDIQSKDVVSSSFKIKPSVDIIFGIKFNMKIVTSPMGRGSGLFQNPIVTIVHLGYNVPMIELFDGEGDSDFRSISFDRSKSDTFFHQYVCSCPNEMSSAMCIGISSDSVYPLYITTLSVQFTDQRD